MWALGVGCWLDLPQVPWRLPLLSPQTWWKFASRHRPDLLAVPGATVAQWMLTRPLPRRKAFVVCGKVAQASKMRVFKRLLLHFLWCIFVFNVTQAQLQTLHATLLLTAQNWWPMTSSRICSLGPRRWQVKHSGFTATSRMCMIQH